MAHIIIKNSNNAWFVSCVGRCIMNNVESLAIYYQEIQGPSHVSEQGDLPARAEAPSIQHILKNESPSAFLMFDQSMGNSS